MIVKEAVVWPDLKMTVAGTVRDWLVDDTLTIKPTLCAGDAKVMVPVTGSPLAITEELRVSDSIEGLGSMERYC